MTEPPPSRRTSKCARASSEGEFKRSPSHKRSNSSSNLSTYNTKSISKHYALNNQILAAFDSLYDQQQYKGAYAFGIQFVEVALLEIPKHGYFYSKRHATERILHSQNALRVTKQLLGILQDLWNIVEGDDWDRVQTLKALAQEQVLSEQQHVLGEETYEQDRRAVESELLQTSSVGGYLLCGDIMEYAEMLCPAPKTQEPPTTEYKLPGKSDSEKQQPLVTPPAKMPISSEGSIDDLQRALFVSGAVASGNDSVASHHTSNTAASTSSSHHHHRRKRSVTAIDFMSLQLCFHEDFCDLRQRGRVRISQAATHQGRLPGSINGCTVIAPLLCVHHFHNNWDDEIIVEEAAALSHRSVGAHSVSTRVTSNKDSERSIRSSSTTGTITTRRKAPDAGLLDAVITEVIDFETPAILPQVRENLGLTKDALIIPSDVHEFLIDKQLLASEQFVTVVGGNILDDNHITGFVNELVLTGDAMKDDRKLAATFFFHEHVVAILRLQRSEKEVWYDLIDSLPNAETLRRVGERPHSFYDPPANASRIRCKDEEALKMTIKWFACSRFTDDNKQYIDMYDWDEMYSDFDPRVFQAFIWAEMK